MNEHQMLDEQVEANLRQAAELMDALNTNPGKIDLDEACRQIEEMPVSMEISRRITLALTVGGPHIEVSAEMTGDDAVITDARISGHWGSARIDRELLPDEAMFAVLRRHAAEICA